MEELSQNWLPFWKNISYQTYQITFFLSHSNGLQEWTLPLLESVGL